VVSDAFKEKGKVDSIIQVTKFFSKLLEYDSCICQWDKNKYRCIL